MEELQTNVKQGALIGGWVCFGVGILFMVHSLWAFIFYGPLFFAAFVLSIVAMAQRRIGGGLALLRVWLRFDGSARSGVQFVDVSLAFCLAGDSAPDTITIRIYESNSADALASGISHDEFDARRPDTITIRIYE